MYLLHRDLTLPCILVALIILKEFLFCSKNGNLKRKEYNSSPSLCAFFLLQPSRWWYIFSNLQFTCSSLNFFKLLNAVHRSFLYRQKVVWLYFFVIIKDLLQMLSSVICNCVFSICHCSFPPTIQVADSSTIVKIYDVLASFYFSN